jgi:nitroimidazol reductase NimA-like FMN-containing flavoprotein (pyridoxamine 5'-phosphate oxidase superfamily)
MSMPPSDYTMPLDGTEGWAKLRSKSYGRLAVSVDGQPDIFPVNFLADESGILIRTAEGTKLELIHANARVAFEVDDGSSERAWSVVVKGIAARLDGAAAAVAVDAPLWTWAPGSKDVFIHIRPTEVTGRLFTRP